VAYRNTPKEKAVYFLTRPRLFISTEKVKMWFLFGEGEKPVGLPP
jgi:hypothetical protein